MSDLGVRVFPGCLVKEEDDGTKAESVGVVSEAGEGFEGRGRVLERSALRLVHEGCLAKKIEDQSGMGSLIVSGNDTEK